MKSLPSAFFGAALAACIGLTSLGHAAGTPRVGMAVDVQGGVSAGKAGKMQRLELLAYLEPGTRVELAAGARASLSMYASRTVVLLAGPGVYEVGDKAIRALSGAPPVSKPLGQKLVLAAQPADRIHGAVRMRDAARIDLVAPVDGEALVAPPARLEWESADPGPFTLTVSDESTGEALVETKVDAPAWAAAEGAVLRPGGQYRWQVTPAPPSTSVRTGRFRVLTSEEAASVAAARPSPDAPIAEWVVYASTLRDAGVVTEARAAWRHIAEKRPDLARARQLAR